MSNMEAAIDLAAAYCGGADATPFEFEKWAAGRGQGPRLLLLNRPLPAHQIEQLEGPGRDFFIIEDHERPDFDPIKQKLRHFATLGGADAQARTWIGHTGPTVHYRADNAPVVVSYFTRDTSYERRAQELQASIEALGDYPFYIMGLEDSGLWEVNCSIKALFVWNVLNELKRPVLWVDADARVFREPVIDDRFDFAVHRFDGWEFASGTVFFNTTESALKLVRRWVELCLEKPLIWDQILLDQAWAEVSAGDALVTGWLPETFTFIYDRDRDALPDGVPVIEHYQESRAVPSKRPKPLIPERLRIDRRMARTGDAPFPDLQTGQGDTGRGPVDNWPAVQLGFESLLKIMQNNNTELGRHFFFVQVGAMDGVKFDPIYESVRAGAWHGLLIEPLPDIFEDLKNNYGEQPGLHFINAAIDREAGERTMYRIPKDRVEQAVIPEWALGISSFYNDRNALGGKQVDEQTRRLIDTNTVQQTVRCTTFDQLLDEYAVTRMDLLQIDTEGHDWAVLQSFPFDRIKPGLIGFEHYNLPDDELRAALDHLKNLGYAYSMDHKDVTATLLRYPG